MYISSADFMTRNTERRVEVAAPVLDRALADRVCGIFRTMCRDNVKAREQGADGLYRHVRRAEGEEALNSQIYFYEQSYKAAQQANTETPAPAAAKAAPEASESAAQAAPESAQGEKKTVSVKIRRIR